MNGRAAIERNRVALVRIVAALAAMAGFALGPDGPQDVPARNAEGEPQRTLPRCLWRAVLRLLRPAESAARRLVIAAARGLIVTPRARPIPNPSPQVGGGHGSAAAKSPSPLWGGVRGGGQRQKIALPLFDRLRRVGPRPLASRDLPRISVPGWTARLPVPVRIEPSPDDPINGARLALRLDALARALDDLPRQARRFARWQAASRVAAGAQDRNHAGPQPGRFRRLSPLRGGPPPGGRLARFDSRDAAGAQRRRNPGHVREIDEILAHAHDLALYALERPDTS